MPSDHYIAQNCPPSSPPSHSGGGEIETIHMEVLVVFYLVGKKQACNSFDLEKDQAASHHPTALLRLTRLLLVKQTQRKRTQTTLQVYRSPACVNETKEKG